MLYVWSAIPFLLWSSSRMNNMRECRVKRFVNNNIKCAKIFDCYKFYCSWLGQVAYLLWQARGVRYVTPNLMASSNLALPEPATGDLVWKSSREVSSDWDSWSTGVAASSHTYLLPQSLSSILLIASKMNSSPIISSSTMDLLPRRPPRPRTLLPPRLPRVMAARAPPAKAPAPMAATTPKRIGVISVWIKITKLGPVMSCTMGLVMLHYVYIIKMLILCKQIWFMSSNKIYSVY